MLTRGVAGFGKGGPLVCTFDTSDSAPGESVELVNANALSCWAAEQEHVKQACHLKLDIMILIPQITLL